MGATLALAACGDGETTSDNPAPQPPPSDQAQDAAEGAGAELGPPDAAEVEALADPLPAALATPTEQFVAAADLVCRESRALVDRLREPQSVAESAEVLAEIVDISTAELSQLSAIDAPAELVERYAEMLALRSEQIAALSVFGEALRADDREAAGEALLESSRLSGESEALQEELGIELCGASPVQEVPNQRRVPDPAAG